MPKTDKTRSTITGKPLGQGRAAPHRRLVAGGQLPVRRPDLPDGQPAAARAAAARARQATPARALGHHARAELRLRPPQPGDHARATSTMMYVIGPGHGGPGPGRVGLAGGHLQRGLPDIAPGRGGHAPAVHAVLVPRRHPEPRGTRRRPGSIHEGGELGYSLSHAYGAAFDNPDLVVAAVVGDGEAETGPLATSWHCEQVRRPAPRRRRAADPAPQRLQDRQPDGAGPDPRARSCSTCCAATATRRTSSRAPTRPTMHQAFAATLDHCLDEIRDIQQRGPRPAGGDRRAPAAGR